jgi:hypothetical protein
VISEPEDRADSNRTDAVKGMSMQHGEFAQRFIQMLRPENVGNAAQTAITWLKPPLAPIGTKPLRLANFSATPGNFSATLGRLGARSAAGAGKT